MSFKTTDFLKKSIETPSNKDVTEFRHQIRNELDEHGIDVEIDSAGNLIASKGSGSPHLVLNSHMDTVSPHIEFDEDEERIYGRGACDAKASIAVFIKTILETEPEKGKLSLALTPDEETDSRSVDELELNPDAVIVGEPSNCDICNSSKGRFEVEITVTGESAHAAHPESGTNALTNTSRIITVLENFDSGEDDEELGSPTLTPTVISGGESSNVVPEECKLRIDRRSVPGETMQEFIDRLSRFIDNLDIDAEIEIERGANNSPLLGSFRTSEDTKIMKNIRKNTDTNRRPFDAVCEASYFADKGIPTVVYGPGKLKDEKGGVAHSDREYIRKEKIKQAEETIQNTVKEYLN